jgi:hypothetical protein
MVADKCQVSLRDTVGFAIHPPVNWRAMFNRPSGTPAAISAWLPMSLKTP